MQEGEPLLIRTDASATIGSGHVMRCLALAQAWQDQGGDVTLLARELPAPLAERLRAEQVRIAPLLTQTDPRADVDATVRAAQEVGARWIVADGYQFGLAFQQEVKSAGGRLLLLDDYGHAERYVADLVLNQNIDARAELYAERSDTTRLLLGTQFALLRREFTGLQVTETPPAAVATKLLITLGGADPSGVTRLVLQGLVGVETTLDVVAVVGASNRFGEEIRALAEAAPHRVLIRHDARDIAALMQWADVAISAGGTTCWELAYLGVPKIIVILADNQRGIAGGLDEAGVSISLGWYADLTGEALASAVDRLVSNVNLRQEMSRRGRALVDGQGSSRVCQLLREG